MATTAAPYGFRPVGVLGAGTFSGATRQYKVTNSYGTSIFYGDVVKLVAAGTVEKDTGTTALTPLGIFVGCSYTDPGTNQPTYAQYWPASTSATDIKAYVVDDPNTLPVKIIGFVDGPSSVVGDTYTDVLCKFNGPGDATGDSCAAHQLQDSTGI